MVLGFHSMCPERERNSEFHLTEFPFLSIVAIYFTHFSFKGRKQKSLLVVAGSILRNSLLDKIRMIINLAAYELNANFTFLLVFPTAFLENFAHFVQQLKPSTTTQPPRQTLLLKTFKLSSLCMGGKKRRRYFVIWFRYFGDRGSSACLLRRGFEAGLCILFIDPISLGASCEQSSRSCQRLRTSRCVGSPWPRSGPAFSMQLATGSAITAQLSAWKLLIAGSGVHLRAWSIASKNSF